MSESTGSEPLLAARAAVDLPKWARLGALFGLVCAAAIALYGPVGVSSTYTRVVGAALRRIAPGYAAANPYLLKLGGVVAPDTMLVIGLLIGGYLAARLGRARTPAAQVEFVHARETTVLKRYADAFVGGFLILFGSNLAGGCTSGHIISGITQLSVSGLIFGAAVFASGIPVALALRGGRRTQR